MMFKKWFIRNPMIFKESLDIDSKYFNKCANYLFWKPIHSYSNNFRFCLIRQTRNSGIDKKFPHALENIDCQNHTLQ